MATQLEPDIHADEDAFRTEVQQFLAANFPDELKNKGNALAGVDGPTDETPAQKAWREAVGERGWGTPTWPKQYGGGGLSKAQAKIIDQEFAKAGAYNPIGGMGVMMFGPTLLEYGSEEQKMEHIPPICRGEIRWCQGYSEPNAGSDLANLQTFAEDKGDHYLVNGQKTWTSGGQWADKCFAIVRTDKSDKHRGISFMLIDMDTPGVEVRPITMISGTSPFCETFFTDVKVPKENLVGEEGQGWTIGKRLLQHERTNISGGGSLARLMGQSLGDIAKKYQPTGADGELADAVLRDMILSRKQADTEASPLAKSKDDRDDDRRERSRRDDDGERRESRDRSAREQSTTTPAAEDTAPAAEDSGPAAEDTASAGQSTPQE